MAAQWRLISKSTADGARFDRSGKRVCHEGVASNLEFHDWPHARGQFAAIPTGSKESMPGGKLRAGSCQFPAAVIPILPDPRSVPKNQSGKRSATAGCYAELTASFNALVGANLGTLLALMVICSPVDGLRPNRCARVATVKLPKPKIWTVSP